MSAVPSLELMRAYSDACSRPSDIYEHVPIMSALASQCNHVTEIGVRNIVSTWGLLYGLKLADDEKSTKSYVGVDLNYPPAEQYNKLLAIAQENNIDLKFLVGNDLTLELPKTDLLFIDSLHTYCHLTAELEKFQSNASKFIAFHDTSYPWGNVDDSGYQGDYSEYDKSIDRNKKGLWPAVSDFLERHKDEWMLKERRTNNHGFTVIMRISRDLVNQTVENTQRK